MKWLILILGIICNASASILVKISMTPPRVFPSISNMPASLLNIPFWIGLLLYGGAFLLYAAALSKLPLNVAHPVLTSGAIAAVSLVSIVYFRENYDWTLVLGIAFVIIGVILITLRA